MHDGRRGDVRGDSPVREARWLALLLPGCNNSCQRLLLNETWGGPHAHLNVDGQDTVLPALPISITSIMSWARCEDKVFPILQFPWELPSGSTGMDHREQGKPGEILIFSALVGWGGGVAQVFNNYLSLGHKAWKTWWSPKPCLCFNEKRL